MVEELSALGDLEEKYEALIEMGRDVPDVPQERKTEACKVHGCQSLVYAYAELDQAGLVRPKGHADALIVNGLLALLVLGLDALKPADFLAVDPKFIESTGVIGALTPSRVNGFYNIYQKLKADVLERVAGH